MAPSRTQINLGIILSFKESARILEQSGQWDRFVSYYLTPYSRTFNRVFVFGWEKEVPRIDIPNVVFVPNKKGVNPYLYAFTMPFTHKKIFQQCQVLRLMQYTAIIPALIAKARHTIKIVATYGYPYAAFFRTKGKTSTAFLWKIVERIGMKKVDAFIVTYPTNKEFLKKRGIPSQLIHILPNGVDTDLFVPQQRKKGGAYEILFVGRLEKEKNPINFARALVTTKENIHVSIIGEGSYRDGMEAIFKSAPIPYTFFGAIPHEKLPSYYASADIFVLPSYAEGSPKALIEAFSCGCACVVGKYPGYQDIARDEENCLVCEHSPEDIAATLRRLIHDDTLRRRLSLAARKYALEHHNIRAIISKEIEMISNL